MTRLAIKAALEILGHQRVHHAYELYRHPEQCNAWLAAWQTKLLQRERLCTPPAWNEMLHEYTAITDMPAVCFAPELIKAFPRAKVILAQRPAESWYESFNRGVIETYWKTAPVTAVLSFLDPQLARPVHRLWTRLFATPDGYFGSTTRNEMQQHAISVYEEHNREIIAAVPSDRLLHFQVTDGWEPLCTFLSVDVPTCPFPRINEGAAIEDVVSTFVRRSLLKVARNMGMLFISIIVGVFAFHWSLVRAA